MSSADASERQLADFRHLVEKVATPARLAECAALLALLPEPLAADSPNLDARVRRLSMLLGAVVARARTAIAANPRTMHDRDVVAAAALMGLVTDTPEERRSQSSV